MRIWQWHCIAIVALTAASGAGCGRTGMGLNGKTCVPGDQIACTGSGGCTGVQQCTADGSGYGACSCGVPGDGGGGDGGGGGDAGRDSGGPEAGACGHCGALACCNTICADTNTDTNNCGQCGNACLPGPGPDCVMGLCGCAANSGRGCTGGTCCGNGCKDLLTDTLNCGECGHTCTANHACQNGSCQCGGSTCTSTQTCCGNRCVDTNTDRRNCGSCGNQCRGGTSCVNGLCGGTNNCGPGGRPCPPGQQCCPNICCTICLGGVCMDGHDAGT